MGALSAKFGDLDLARSQLLASAIGRLCQSIYEAGYNNALCERSGHQIFVVAVEGKPESGKSTYSKNIVTVNVDDDEALKNAKAYSSGVDAEPGEPGFGREFFFYHSIWSNKAWQHNQLYDALWVRGAYGIDGEVSDSARSDLPERQASGFEIVEHPYAVPENVIGVKLSLSIQDDDLRTAHIHISRHGEQYEAAWDEFLKCALDEVYS